MDVVLSIFSDHLSAKKPIKYHKILLEFLKNIQKDITT